MQQLLNEQSELITKYINQNETLLEDDRHEIQTLMQNVVLRWVEYDQAIESEVDKFVVHDESTDTFTFNYEKCPKLAEIWLGDAYGEEGIAGLKKFLTEVKRSDTLEDVLFAECTKLRELQA